MDPNQLFAQALPLPHPWTVTSSSLQGNPKKLTITADLLEGTKQLPIRVNLSIQPVNF